MTTWVPIGFLPNGSVRKSREQGSSEQGLLTERFYGKYQRSVTLPTAVDPDKVTATYKDGLLQVVLPKAEEAKPKQIEVALK